MDPEVLALNRIARILRPLDFNTRSRVCRYLAERYTNTALSGGGTEEKWIPPWEIPKVPPTEPLSCPHGCLLGETCWQCGNTDGAPNLAGAMP